MSLLLDLSGVDQWTDVSFTPGEKIDVIHVEGVCAIRNSVSVARLADDLAGGV